MYIREPTYILAVVVLCYQLPKFDKNGPNIIIVTIRINIQIINSNISSDKFSLYIKNSFSLSLHKKSNANKTNITMCQSRPNTTTINKDNEIKIGKVRNLNVL